MTDWQEYEKLAARIYSELEPYAQVRHNDRIEGVNSGRKRQIEVSIRAIVADIDLLIVVQAKNYTRPAGISAVEAFASVVRDVRAAKGILICNAGFTKPAKDCARNIGIDLCSLHDAQSRNWSLDIKLPLLWIDYLPTANLEFKCFFQAGDSIPRDPRQWVLSADDGKTRLLPLQIFERKWNALKLDRSCGTIHNLVPEQKDIKVLVDGGVWRPVESLIIKYIVYRRAWLGYFRPSECRGILNRIKNEFTVSYFNIGDIPMKRDESWVPVEDPEKLVIATKGILVTTERWEISVNDAEFNFAVKKIE